MTNRVIIVDDERSARDRIRRLLEQEPDVQVIAECADGASAVDQVRAGMPDVLVLDVQLPEQDGFEVLEELGIDIPPAVVFVTASDRYALRAFAVHAVDYVLKPLDDARFRQAFARARGRAARTADADAFQGMLAELRGSLAAELLHGSRASGDVPTRGFAERLLVEVKDRIVPIRVDDIDWIEAAGNHVRIHAHKQARLLRDTLARMDAQLDPTRFARIHRRAIVNLDRIQEVHPWFSGDAFVVLTTGEKLRLSRSFRRAFESRFAGELLADGA